MKTHEYIPEVGGDTKECDSSKPKHCQQKLSNPSTQSNVAVILSSQLMCRVYYCGLVINCTSTIR